MSKPTLGIIGGGQLGSMLSLAARKLGIKTIVLCDDIDAPAKNFQMILFTASMMIKKRIDEFYK